MNNDTFLETLHNTYEEQDSQPTVDPLANLGFTPGFGADGQSPNQSIPQISSSSKEYFQNIPPFRVELVDINQSHAPQFKGLQGKKLV